MNSKVLASLVILVAASGAAAETAPVADPAQASYEAALALTRAKSFEQAEFAWLNFLRQYPNNPLDANAEFFLGETYYGRNDFRHAAAAYAAGAEQNSKGELAPETLLKLGISLGRTGDARSACDALARLERQFPSASGVVRERTLVEKRQYHCPDAPPANPANLANPATADLQPKANARAAPSPDPDTATQPPLPTAASPEAATPQAAPAKAAPAPPAGKDAAATDGTTVSEPAPLAQPITPVDRKPLPDVDAERAAARAELVVSPAPIAPRPSRNIASGAAADTIKTAQNLLTALDYDVGPIDGQAGPKLRDAVRAFQTKDGLHPDGEVSSQLLEHLSAALAAPGKGSRAAPSRYSAGTGFVVSKSGFVITSYHLVAACAEIRVGALGSEAVATPLVASDQHDDLALLHLKSPAVMAATFHDGRGPRQGDGVVLTGLSPGEAGSSDFYMTTGVVSALSGARDDNGVLKIDAPVKAERGGAPVFDRTGNVIGVLASATLPRAKPISATQGSGIALRATIVRNFLDAHDVDYESGASAAQLKAVDIGALAKQIVVLVECRH